MKGVLVTAGMQNLRRNFKGRFIPFKVDSGTELSSSGLCGRCFHLLAIALASLTRLEKTVYACRHVGSFAQTQYMHINKSMTCTVT